MTWREELVFSLVFSLSSFRASSGFSTVGNTVKAVLLGMIGRQGE